ncbi:Uncharacterised protein [Bordetella pertussis]|nr:Uncharacterised protein [Bordetella pertussis]CFO76314.1 Uncharacterised protein [Bordetella pertussis]CPI36398.1 Uncharacterised protein [Bordetella pertussis]CPL13068.1 Uncharacterised protein [Bordetella pertussis]CPL99928.1 Uncharacterised protein [Bordetella pertussis]
MGSNGSIATKWSILVTGTFSSCVICFLKFRPLSFSIGVSHSDGKTLRST